MDAYDRYVVRRGHRMYVVRRLRRRATRNLDEEDDDDYHHHGEYAAPFLPGTRVPIIMDHDPRDLSSPDGSHDESVATKRARVAEATEAAIQRLPEVKLVPPAEECAVCLKDFDALDKLRAMPCAHSFQEPCIFRWLRRNAICPLCRHPLPTPTLQETDQQLSIEAHHHP